MKTREECDDAAAEVVKISARVSAVSLLVCLISVLACEEWWFAAKILSLWAGVMLATLAVVASAIFLMEQVLKLSARLLSWTIWKWSNRGNKVGGVAWWEVLVNALRRLIRKIDSGH